MSSPAMSAAPSAAPSTPSVSSAPAPSSTPAPSSSPSSSSAPATPTAKSGSGGGDPGAKSVDGAAAPSAAEVKEAIRKHKLKVNGREMEMDEPEVLRRAQLAEGAEQKFQQAAEIRKQAAELLDALKKNPIGVLKQLGLDPRKVSEEHLAGELQREMMTPEQRELQELRDYRAQQEKARQEQEMTQKERVKQAELQKLQQAAAAEYDKTITEVLAESNLPKTPQTVKRVAELLKSALEKGYELDAKTAVDMVRQGYMGDIQSLFGGLKGEALVKQLGEPILKELRKYDLEQIKKKLAPPAADGVTPPSAAPQTRPAEKSKYLNQDDWREALRKKAGVEF